MLYHCAKFDWGNHDVKHPRSKLQYGLISKLTMDKGLSGVFDDTAFLKAKAAEEGKDIYAYSGEVAALSRAVTSELVELAVVSLQPLLLLLQTVRMIKMNTFLGE